MTKPDMAQRILFLQIAEPGAYPPLINASAAFAEAGWSVAFLAAPVATMHLPLPADPRIRVASIATRREDRVGALDYVRYCAAAARFALRFRPDVVYASDALGAGPGLIAARLAGARLVYHEHDSFNPGEKRPPLSQARRAAVRTAALVIFPNEGRARIAREELGFPAERLRIVWNLPRLGELPVLPDHLADGLLLHYHGSINAARLPLAIVDALRPFGGRVKLQIAGYNAARSPGYVESLVAASNGMATWLGQIPRNELLPRAAAADAGLSFMPVGSDDINMANMTGASNKAFDYMAAGLPLVVSDLPDWRRMFVPAYARACHQEDAASLAATVQWLIDNPAERRAMAARGRARIETEWNYDKAFAPVVAELGAT